MTVSSRQGDKKEVIAQLERSLLSLLLSARSSPHCMEAQLHIQHTEEAQSSDLPFCPRQVPPGLGPHHFVVVVGLDLF